MASKAALQLDVISYFVVSAVKKKKSSYRIEKKKNVSLPLLRRLTL
jgi:hypothetical protein